MQKVKSLWSPINLLCFAFCATEQIKVIFSSVHFQTFAKLKARFFNYEHSFQTHSETLQTICVKTKCMISTSFVFTNTFIVSSAKGGGNNGLDAKC